MTSTLSRKKELTLEDLVLRYGGIELQGPVSKTDFAALSNRYPKFRMEREKNGITTIMSPVKRSSGRREFSLSGYFFVWYQKNRKGEFYSPSTGFELPDGTIKSPDVAWIAPERLTALPEGSEKGFISLAPDFVAEIRSESDRLKKLQDKMTDTWMANGVRLAWLIDPGEEKAYIYRQGQEMETVEGFSGKNLSGEEVLPGFVLDLSEML